MNNATHLLAAQHAKGAYTMSRDPFASSCSTQAPSKILKTSMKKNISESMVRTACGSARWPNKDQMPTPAAPESHCPQISSCRLRSMVSKTAPHNLSEKATAVMMGSSFCTESDAANCAQADHGPACLGFMLLMAQFEGNSQCTFGWAGRHAADGADAGAIRDSPRGPLVGTIPAQVFCFNIHQPCLLMLFSGPEIAICHCLPAMQQVDCCNQALARQQFHVKFQVNNSDISLLEATQTCITVAALQCLQGSLVAPPTRQEHISARSLYPQVTSCRLRVSCRTQ